MSLGSCRPSVMYFTSSFFFSSRRRHTRLQGDWSSDVCSSDLDFISLVEKLKQYNKTVFIVGGRAFTSTILQKNCREFISYESLLASSEPTQSRPDRKSVV